MKKQKTPKRVKLWGSCSAFIDKIGKIYLYAPDGNLYRIRLSKLPKRFYLETESGMRFE